MFSPHEVQAWKGLASADPALLSHYCGHTLETVQVICGTGITPQREKYVAGTLRAPAHIFGEPFVKACLNGIGTWPVHSTTAQILSFDNARIVGKSALLSEDNKLYAPIDAGSLSRQEFVDANAFGHQGFLIDDSEESVSIKFARRETIKHYALDALFLPNIEPGNFGSFMFRQLPQLFALRGSGLKFDCYITSDRTAYLQEALVLLNFPNKPVFSTEEVAGDRFKSITLHKMDDAEGFLSPAYRTAVHGFVNRLMSAPTAKASARLIYISRSLSALRHPWYRVMKNEQAVEAYVQSRGFEVVYPEVLSLEAQMRTFSSASRVIGPSGSGMFNVLFSRKLERVVDIETFTVAVRQHAKLYSSCGADYSFLFAPYCDDDGDENPVNRSYFCPDALLHPAVDWLLEGI